MEDNNTSIASPLSDTPYPKKDKGPKKKDDGATDELPESKDPDGHPESNINDENHINEPESEDIDPESETIEEPPGEISSPLKVIERKSKNYK